MISLAQCYISDGDSTILFCLTSVTLLIAEATYLNLYSSSVSLCNRHAKSIRHCKLLMIAPYNCIHLAPGYCIHLAPGYCIHLAPGATCIFFLQYYSGADTTASDKFCMNPFMLAVEKGNLEVVNAMMDQDPDLMSKRLGSGSTMAHWALKQGHHRSDFFKVCFYFTKHFNLIYPIPIFLA